MSARRLDGSPVGWAAAAALVVFPALLALDYIHRFAVDVPYGDDWDLVPLLMDEPAPSFAALFELHMEHRLFFPRLVMLLLARATHGDARANMYTTWGLLCATAAILLSGHVRAHGWTPRSLLLFAPIASLIFTLRQHANLLWGWQVQIALALAAFVAAAACLERLDRGRWRLPAAIGLGIVSGFSYAAGMAIWPAGLLQLVYQRFALRRPRRLAIAAWLVASFAAFAIYLWGYRHPTWPTPAPSAAYVLARPLASLEFTLALLGNALFDRLDLALPMGLLLSIAAIAAVVVTLHGQLEWARASPAIPLFGLGTMSAAMVAIGRAGVMDIIWPGFGLEFAVHSRYVTLVVLVVIALYQLCLAARDRRYRIACTAVLLSLIAVSVGGSLVTDYRIGRETRAERRQLAELLRSYRERSDEELRPLFRDTALLRGRAAILERDRLSSFRGAR